MRFAAIKPCDIANGEGVRVSLFVSGCRHHCPGCFNQSAWDFEAGDVFDDCAEARLLDLLAPPYIDGLSLLGGEPFEPENQRPLADLLERVRAALPEKTVWCYTGFTLEELAGTDCRAAGPDARRLLGLIDVLVDGPFVERLKNIALVFRGSENQRIIDLAASRREKHIVQKELKSLYVPH